MDSYSLPPTRWDRIKASLTTVVYTIVGFSADGLHAVLRATRIIVEDRRPTDYRMSDVDHLSDAELRSHLDTTPYVSLSDEAGVELNDGQVRRCTKDTIAKESIDRHGGPTSESLTLDLVFHHTTIPVPRVRRNVRFPDNTIATVMDFIPGRQLLHVWPTMSLFQKLRVAFILRRYVRQLRSIRHPRSHIPGPVGPESEPRRPGCHMIIGVVERVRSPSRTRSEFSSWWNKMYAISMEKAPQVHKGVPREPFDDTQPLVLTHCDINMRNILVGDDGRLYLLDWELSGFYPPWFESVNWRYWLWAGFGGPASALEREDRLWNLLVPFISMGPCFRQEWWFRRVMPVMDNYD